MKTIAIVLLLTAAITAQSVKLTPHKITLSGRSITLIAPDEFEIIPAAEGSPGAQADTAECFGTQ